MQMQACPRWKRGNGPDVYVWCMNMTTSIYGDQPVASHLSVRPKPRLEFHLRPFFPSFISVLANPYVRLKYVYKNRIESVKAVGTGRGLSDLIVLHKTRGIPGTSTESIRPRASPANGPRRYPYSLALSPRPNSLLHATYIRL